MSVAQTKRIDEVDRYVGIRVSQWRIMRGLTQQQLATLIGRSWSQVQKYENGTSRIFASTLHRIAQVLDVKVELLFEQGEDQICCKVQARRTVRLVRTVWKLGYPLQRAVCNLTLALSEPHQETP
jgi:transcriptional regulator with XRE-family HTH domain